MKQIFGKDEFEEVTRRNLGEEVFEKLSRASVAVAGLGGLGSRVAPALARAGIGRLIIADFDIVEPSNLNRQDYFIDQLGIPKVEAMTENLARINPGLALEGHNVRLEPESICRLFGRADVIIECFDRAEQKQMLVETVLAKLPERLVISASGLAGFGKSNAITTRFISRYHITVGDFVSQSKPGTGLFAARVGIAALHQANAAIEWIIKHKESVRI